MIASAASACVRPLSIARLRWPPSCATCPVAIKALIVTAGVGWVQQDGKSVEEMRPGDVVWIPPGVKHWHGAAATTGMTHIAITESLDGKNSEWMEKVSDEQYHK